MRVFFDSWFYITLSKLPLENANNLLEQLQTLKVEAVISITLHNELTQATSIAAKKNNLILYRLLYELPTIGIDGVEPGWEFLKYPNLAPDILEQMKTARGYGDQARIYGLKMERENNHTNNGINQTLDVDELIQPELDGIRHIIKPIFDNISSEQLATLDPMFGGHGRTIQFRNFVNGLAKFPSWLIEWGSFNRHIDSAAYHNKTIPTMNNGVVPQKHRGHLRDASHIRAFIQNEDIIDLFFCDKKQYQKIIEQPDHPIRTAGLLERVLTGTSAQEAIELLYQRSGQLLN